MKTNVIMGLSVALLVSCNSALAATLEQCSGAGEKRLECVQRNTELINKTMEDLARDLRKRLDALDAAVSKLPPDAAEIATKRDVREKIEELEKTFSTVKLKGHQVKECIFQAAPHGVALAECSSAVGNEMFWVLERYGK